jgi:hypothetical protein
MSMTKNTVKYVLIFIGLLIFLAAYLFVYMDYSDKTEALNKEITTLNDRLDQLNGYHEQIPAYESSIVENKAFIDETLGRYYSNETPEDFIMFATDMEGTLSLDINALSFTQPQPFCSITAVKDTGDYTVPVGAATLTGYKISSTIDGTMTYSQMKSALKFIYSQIDTTKLDSLNMNYDSSTGLILGSFVIDKYFIAGRDIQEHQATVPYNDLGKDVLIGS